MSNEPKETGRLEGDAARRQARIILLEKENQRLEKALRLCAAGCDIAIQNQQSRIQQLEEALREAQPLVAFHMFNPDGMYRKGERVLRIINVALRSSEAPEKEEGEDG